MMIFRMWPSLAVAVNGRATDCQRLVGFARE
jgi:hypothetical protein